MNKERAYYILLGSLVLIYILVQVLQPKPLDWTESYESDDKIPYGGYLIHELLNHSFPNETLTFNQRSIYLNADSSEQSQNRIFITSSFDPDRYESKRLLEMASGGDHIFISARKYSGLLSDTLEFDTQQRNVIADYDLLQRDTVYIQFVHPQLEDKTGYPYAKGTTDIYFSPTDSLSRFLVIGVNQNEKPNFIRIPFGKGSFFLHSNPRIFTNYFIRDENGAEYAMKALSTLPVQPVVWDEYYKPGRNEASSPVQYLLSKENLRRAWFLALGGILLFMIFNSKRKQRIIPVIEPPRNSSIDFARTISSLYLESGTHKQIATKKIRFFMEYIRSNLGLDTLTLNDEVKDNIAARSGIDSSEIYDLIERINNLSNKEQVSEMDLVQLTEQIDQFYNNSKR